MRGDRLTLSEGDRVPGSALLLVAEALSADESLLTGEVIAVGKRRAQPEELAEDGAGQIVRPAD